MDDPDGLEEPTRLARSRIEEEEGWGLDGPLAGEPEADIDADDDIDITPTGNVLHAQRAG
jgi:hypothetical protein